MPLSLEDRLAQQVTAALPSERLARLGVAVSGGGDSTALLCLLHGIFATGETQLSCVTVDHGLRPEAAEEARAVADLCRRLSVPHTALRWSGWDGKGNLQNAARMARYHLMADWAAAEGVSAIALGHTRDDQAETVLMQLARGAGVDGLSAMSTERHWLGTMWLRPLLEICRTDLRQFLRAEGMCWSEDPSNDDLDYDRIKARAALRHLEPLGIDATTLGTVARNMQTARVALEHQTCGAARSMARCEAGGLRFDRDGFEGQPAEIQRRLLIAALRWITGAGYAPRGRSLSAALEALRASGSATLEGCRLMRTPQRLWVFREHAAVQDLRSGIDQLWDGRWRAVGPIDAGMSLAALGEDGLAACPDWRATGLPRSLLLATPAIWQGDSLVAAPLAGRPHGWSLRLDLDRADPFESVFTH